MLLSQELNDTPSNVPFISENDPSKTIKTLKMTPQQNGRPPITGNKRPAPKVAENIFSTLEG